MRATVIAIDGPAGAGKSTVAREVARRLGFMLLDTGALYRCVALAALRGGLPLDDNAAVSAIVPGLSITFADGEGEGRTLLDGEDVSAEIRTPEVSKGASAVAALPAVREALLPLQRSLARSAARGAVVEGRDIGSTVFADAERKFFIDARPLVRAERRRSEFEKKGTHLPIEEVLQAMLLRDKADEERAVSPLRRAPDSILIDTSDLTFEEVVRKVLDAARP